MFEKNKKEMEVPQKKTIEKGAEEHTREGIMYVPDVDIVEDQEAITLRADLPGVTKDNMSIDVREGVLTLTATVKPPEEHHRQVYREYDIGGFNRRFTLGERIDPEKISASLENGVLTLMLPKAEAHKPRKIEIK